MVLSAFIGLRLTRSITVPMRETAQLADRVAAGDLTGHVVNEGGDELGRLPHSLQRTQDSLMSTVGSVRRHAESVATASAQIAQGDTDLSQRTAADRRLGGRARRCGREPAWPGTAAGGCSVRIQAPVWQRGRRPGDGDGERHGARKPAPGGLQATAPQRPVAASKAQSVRIAAGPAPVTAGANSAEGESF